MSSFLLDMPDLLSFLFSSTAVIFISTGERQMGQIQSAEAASKPQSLGTVTTDELNLIIADYEASFVEEDDDTTPFLSDNTFSWTMPEQRYLRLAEAFSQWDFFCKPYIRHSNMHKQFVRQVKGAFEDLLESLNKLGLSQEDKIKKIGEILSPSAEYRRPSLLYDTQMLLISFITNLTSESHFEEAKALHRIMSLFKKISHKQRNADEQKGLSEFIARACYRGLQLEEAKIAKGHLLQRSQQELFFHIFFTATINLAIRHPVFDQEYAVDIYDIYERMNKRFDKLGFGIAVNPALAANDLPNFFLKALKAKYADLGKRYSQTEGKEGPKAVYAFFLRKIASVAAFDKTPDKAQAMHNFIHVLKQLYAEDHSEPKNTLLYLKALRQFLQIPNHDKDFDTWFDECIISTIFERKNRFDTPFEQSAYSVSTEEQQEYCKLLTQAYEEQVEENVRITDKYSREIILLKTRNNELEHLNATLEQFKNLSLQDKEQSSSKETTPPSSPTGLYHLHRRQKHTTASQSLGSSSPKTRKSSLPSQPSEERLPVGRALSDPALKPGKH